MVVINTQSIKSKEHLIMEYLMDKQVDLAILTETWLCEEDETWVNASECNKNGYRLDTVNRKKRRGGEIGLIYLGTFKVCKCKSKKTQTFEHTIWSMKANDTMSTVLALYHPPYSEKAPITNAMFLDEVTDFLATFLVEYNNIIIMGDFNIHVNNTNDPEAQIFLDTMEALGLDNHVNFATHNRGNILDLVLTEVLSSLLVVPCRQGPFLCWLTKEVLDQKRMVRRRDKIWQKYKTEGTWRALTEHRNKYNVMIREEKLKSTSGKVEESKGDTKMLYSLVRYLTGTKVQNPMPNNTGDKKLANNFADYFIEKIQKIWDDLDGNPKFKPKRNSNITPLKIFEPTTADEVTTIIKEMKTKSCKLDFLPMSLLKKALPYEINTITNIMNVFLEQGVFPDSWKTAIIRPLLKKLGLELITSNYRPVSNLPFLPKVLEKIVLARYNDHCDRYNLIPSFQLAYRPKHSCETSMVKLVNDLLWSMERKEATAVAVIDLSATFDMVDHNILIDLLHETFGTGDKALRWFQSYLKNRYCKVKIGKDYSEKKSLNFSVPQGSCVGPDLYLSYAASVSDVVSDVSEEGDPRPINIIGFADDHAMKKSFIPTLEADEEVCLANMQACLFRVKKVD